MKSKRYVLNEPIQFTEDTNAEVRYNIELDQIEYKIGKKVYIAKPTPKSKDNENL